MNFLQKALARMRHGGRPPMAMGLLKRTRFDYRREVGDCMDTSVVTAPMLWVARALPEANFVVKAKGKDGKLEDRPAHPMLALLQNPNPNYGDIALWMGTLFSFLISGNAYWIIVRNGVRHRHEAAGRYPCRPGQGTDHRQHERSRTACRGPGRPGRDRGLPGGRFAGAVAAFELTHPNLPRRGP